MGFISWIVVGVVVGWLAAMVMKGGGYGVIADIVLGVIGAIVAGVLASTFLGINAAVYDFQSVILATIGAIVLVLGGRLLINTRSSTI